MISFAVRLFFLNKKRAKKTLVGTANFKKNGENFWSKVSVFTLKPNDNYIIFYITQNPAGKQNALEMGSKKVNNQGKLIFERRFSSKILDGYCYKEKKIIAVILVRKNDRNIEYPIIGLRKPKIEWRPLVEKHIKALECNHNNILEEYAHNKNYDRIIDSLPESRVLEKRDKIEKAVEINSMSELNFENIPANINCNTQKKPLLIRMKTDNAVLYLLGLPGSFSSDNKIDYMKNGYKTFICNSAEEINNNSEGYWCRYI